MSREREEKGKSLTGRQRRFLRSRGHHLTPVAHIGHQGISEAVLRSIEDVLTAHELIKVKLGRNCPLPKKEAARTAARLTGAELVQLIGKTILLYRENKELRADQRLRLP